MENITLELLAQRLADVESRLAAQERRTNPPDWRHAVGVSEDNEFTRRMLAEMQAIRDADRQAAMAEADE